MNSENFCYWLHGWLEIQNPTNINSKQLNEIKNHLDLSLGNKKENNYIVTGIKNSSTGLLFTNFKNWDDRKLNDTYITITKNPIWNSGEYSSYYNEPEFLKSVNENFNLNLNKDNSKIVIDNELKPKYSPSNKLGLYENNHLVGSHDTGPGLVNIGLSSPLYC